MNWFDYKYVLVGSPLSKVEVYVDAVDLVEILTELNCAKIYKGFLSRTFRIHRTAGERGDYLF